MWFHVLVKSHPFYGAKSREITMNYHVASFWHFYMARIWHFVGGMYMTKMEMARYWHIEMARMFHPNNCHVYDTKISHWNGVKLSWVTGIKKGADIFRLHLFIFLKESDRILLRFFRKSFDFFSLFYIRFIFFPISLIIDEMIERFYIFFGSGSERCTLEVVFTF